MSVWRNPGDISPLLHRPLDVLADCRPCRFNRGLAMIGGRWTSLCNFPRDGSYIEPEFNEEAWVERMDRVIDGVVTDYGDALRQLGDARE